MDNVKERRQSGGNSSEMTGGTPSKGAAVDSAPRGYSLERCVNRLTRHFPNRVSSIGTEELGHLEMIGAIVHQLTRNLSREQIMNSGFAPYYVDHTTGIYPAAASGVPWTAAYMQSKGDPITDLHEDLAADEAYGYRQRLKEFKILYLK